MMRWYLSRRLVRYTLAISSRYIASSLRPVQLQGDLRETVARAGALKRREPLRMPPRLSPTAATTFVECEQLFLFRSLWKLPEPPSAVLEKGTLVHHALEKLFDVQPPAKRTVPKVQEILRNQWLTRRLALHNSLFDNDEEERTWGLECFKLLDNYRAFEDPTDEALDASIASRERWLRTSVLEPRGDRPALALVGKLDRLDKVGEGQHRVVDYKTGESPSVKKYSEAFKEKLRAQAFFQLRVYALLLEDAPERVTELRLLYLGGDAARAEDEALPLDPEARAALLAGVRAELDRIWQRIFELVQSNDPLAFMTCDRSFCYCKVVGPVIFNDDEDDEENAHAATDAPRRRQDDENSNNNSNNNIPATVASEKKNDDDDTLPAVSGDDDDAEERSHHKQTAAAVVDDKPAALARMPPSSKLAAAKKQPQPAASPKEVVDDVEDDATKRQPEPAASTKEVVEYVSDDDLRKCTLKKLRKVCDAYDLSSTVSRAQRDAHAEGGKGVLFDRIIAYRRAAVKHVKAVIWVGGCEWLASLVAWRCRRQGQLKTG